jgi:hypothetical protein
MRAEGQVREEPAFWDCFLYSVGDDDAEITVDVLTGGETYTRTLPVKKLEDDGLTRCPEVRRD